MRSPRDFTKPLAMGAPQPVNEIPVKPSRCIHFFDPSNPKMAAKLPELARQTDILLGNLEDAIPADKKVDAREGLVKIGREVDLGDTPLWTRVNSLDSPWFLDDVVRLVGEIGDRLEVVMIPKVEGPWDIHYVDRLLAQLEARHELKRPLLVHAILETALGVTNVEEICAASPRMQGISFGPADLAASRRMKTTRVGGGHPAYLVRTDPDPKHPDAPRPTAQQDPWHYSIARMVDACAATGCLPFYGPFGDISDPLGCEDQFRAAFLLGCVGAWSLHPSQVAIAKKVFSPPPEEVKFAKRVLEAMPDGRGVLMLDGKMQDDATWKQCRVMVNLAKLLAEKDPEPAAPPRRRWAWADLLRRVFAIDVLTCACGGRLRLIATIEDPLVVQRILRHLGLPTEPPGLYPARPPPGEGDTLVFDFPLERRLRPEAADPDDGAGTTLPAAVCLDVRCRAPQSPAHGSRRASPARAAASSELWREIEG